ncbi:MAG: type IV pilus twitching motility protein PilT [PVC group bacterium]|nr:type IV pilus twitching motility protein PilT [PVC group bacterium]
MEFNIETLAKIMIERRASDLHIHTDSPPQVRVDSKLLILDYPELSPDDSKLLIYSMLTPDEIKHFETYKELDKSCYIENAGRFRMNVFFHRGTVCASLRCIPGALPHFRELGLPEEQILQICRSQSGLVLVTGATGVGKTTTLSAMVNHINSERQCHIVTVEDPIEFVHDNRKSLISQREIGTDTNSFGEALKYVLRQDPDVILIGELRDLETIQAALNIAETGHLVFATLHTSDCVQTINRVVDVFPASQQAQVRTQLSFVLLATISQQLIPRADKQGRALATELMIANFGVKAMIREEKIHQIFSLIQTGQKDGMRTMNQSLFELYKQGIINYQDASLYVTDHDDFKRFFKSGRS